MVCAVNAQTWLNGNVTGRCSGRRDCRLKPIFSPWHTGMRQPLFLCLFLLHGLLFPFRALRRQCDGRRRARDGGNPPARQPRAHRAPHLGERRGGRLGFHSMYQRVLGIRTTYSMYSSFSIRSLCAFTPDWFMRSIACLMVLAKIRTSLKIRRGLFFC